MPEYRAPGVYVEEVSGGARPIEAVGTSTAAFVGQAPRAEAHRGRARAVTNWSSFVRDYVADEQGSVAGVGATHLATAVHGFFANGGRRCYVVNLGAGNDLEGALEALARIDEIAIVAAPGMSEVAAYEALLGHCERLEDRVAILDPPEELGELEALTRVKTTRPASRRGRAAADSESEGEETSEAGGAAAGLRPRQSSYGALYVPWITIRNPLAGEAVLNVPPSGHLAGVWARSDATRGVHKAPANEPVRGALALVRAIGRAEQEELNSNGVNCIRYFTREGIRVWGARTLAESSSEWRYLSVRRLVNMIKESIADGTRWIVFEPNDFTLWKSIRRDVSAFLGRLWRDGALLGRTPEEAFFVKCDEETNPPEVRDAGQVVTEIGIAPVKPAEFVIFRISQNPGGFQVETQGATPGAAAEGTGGS